MVFNMQIFNTITFPSLPRRGGPATAFSETNEIYFRARVVIAIESSLTRIKNIYPLL